jgi:Uncharacterised nucleotidyltransferase
LASESLEQFVRLTSGLPRQRAVDAATTEALLAFDQAAIEVVLLKGPVIATWLYGDGEPRWYNDCDLLLREVDLNAAGAVLAGLGYDRLASPPDDPGLLPDIHSIVWIRAQDSAVVELHWTLVGLAATPESVWETLSGDTAPISVNGVTTRSLGEHARALHLGLHLAQHGRAARQPVEDLTRGIAQLDFGVWKGARVLSERLGGDSAFAAGLRAAGGSDLAARLALPRAETYWTLRADAAPRGALRLRQAKDASGWHDRWVILSEGWSRYREFREERGQQSRLARACASVTDLLAAVRALMRSR